MKIMLSNKPNNDPSYKWASNINTLDSIVLNSEAMEIVCDNFLSSFTLEELPALLNKIISKMRIGCELIILEVDARLLFKRFYVEEIDSNEMNNILFNSQRRKSILDMATVGSYLQPKIKIVSKHYDYGTCGSIIKCKRES